MIVYDNVNFKDIIRDEVLGYRAIMRNLITAVIVICLDLSGSGLQQFMHDGTKHLNVYDIFTAPAISGDDNGIGIRIFTYLISDAIRKVYLSGINAIFDSPSLLLETEAALTISIISDYWGCQLSFIFK